MKNFLYLICILFLNSEAFAKPNIQTINSLSFTKGKAFGYDNSKETFNNFTEVLLSKKASVGGIFQASRIDSNYHNSKAFAINSVEVFSRYKIFSYDKIGITMHNDFKFPGVYREDKYLAQMPKQSDYEFRLLFAHNMKDRLVNTVVGRATPYFSRFEVAYRRRFSNPFDEVRFAFWGGVNLNSKFAILLQDNINWTVRSKPTSEDISRSNMQFSRQSNNMGTASLIYRFEKDMALQVGYIKRLRGNNPFYDRSGVIFGLWNSF